MESQKSKLSYIAVPSQIIRSLSPPSLQGLLPSPSKHSRTRGRILGAIRNPGFCFFILCLIALVGMFRLNLNLDRSVPLSSSPCATEKSSNGDDEVSQISAFAGEASDSGGEFWEQPDGMGYRPCLNFSEEYRKASLEMKRDRWKYLVVGVSGGLNQQRNQIVDAVVIARILGAALVVPVLQVNVVWGDESEFSEIFDVDNFKRVLANDVRVVSSLPTFHLTRRPIDQVHLPPRITDKWLRSKFLRRLNAEGVLVLRGFDSRLAKDLPSDLQKLRCKAAFEALKFSPRVQELGDKLAARMRSRGPYVALHLRLEKDVWVRTGCLPGLTPYYDDVIRQERKLHPDLLTAKTKMGFRTRKAAGLCPLTALELTRYLKALGAPRDANIFWAGGEPFGGAAALFPLVNEFPNLFNKFNLSSPGELEPYHNRSSILAAVDFIISEKSEVFMPSHGGNMAHILKGLRAYGGHKKFITPNKRQMVPYLLNKTISEEEFSRIVKELHNASLGQPMPRSDKIGKDVTAYPIPECMCSSTARGIS